MKETTQPRDVEKSVNNNAHGAESLTAVRPSNSSKANTNPFIGRLGGNQAFVLDRHDAANAELLKEQPDAAPYMTIRQQLDLNGFKNLGLWKAALIEGMGKDFSPARPATLVISINPLLQAPSCSSTSQSGSTYPPLKSPPLQRRN
jgi:hypothetical protein